MTLTIELDDATAEALAHMSIERGTTVETEIALAAAARVKGRMAAKRITDALDAWLRVEPRPVEPAPVNPLPDNVKPLKRDP